MVILKTETVANAEDLATFINRNAISRENILSVTSTYNGAILRHTVFFYAEDATKEISKGFFGWDKE